MATEIISRAEAKARGLKWFFTGEPCIHGHLVEKIVSSGRCKTCSAHSHGEWQRNNRDRVNRLRDEHYARSGKTNKDACRQRYYKNHEKYALQRAENRELLRQKTDEWRKRNPDKSRHYAKQRRALKKGSSGTHTIEEIQNLKRKQHSKCASCFASIKQSFHADHIEPLSRGGSNGIDNIQLLCVPCNRRKYNKSPLVWARENGRLL
jgi:5-methylcytosine-specific restriction endonuclease McrA